jgi:ferredoxin--NADP+ reductase
VKANLDAMHSIATMERSEKNKQLEFHFGYKPKEIRGTEKVESVIFSTLHGDIEIEADLVVTAIGYEADSGLNLSVDGNHFKNSDGFVEDNLYVVGWAKRGPTGVIGTSKSDATEVAKKIVSELSLRTPKEDLGVNEVVRDLNFLNLTEWRRINDYEISKGANAGRPRVKLKTIQEMIRVSKGGLD